MNHMRNKSKSNKKSKPTTPPVEAISVMVWNMNGGAIPEKTVRRLEGAISSIIGDCRNARLLYDIVKEY